MSPFGLSIEEDMYSFDELYVDSNKQDNVKADFLTLKICERVEESELEEGSILKLILLCGGPRVL